MSTLGRRLSPAREPDGTFFCSGCMRRWPLDDDETLGFCRRCILRGHRFWARQLGLDQAVALAVQIFGAELVDAEEETEATAA